MGFAARIGPAVDAVGRIFADLDIEILRSVKAASHRTTEAPPRPWSQRGRISERPWRPERVTVPLQSRPNASPFWIMLLLSSRDVEHEIIEISLPGTIRWDAARLISCFLDLKPRIVRLIT